MIQRTPRRPRFHERTTAYAPHGPYGLHRNPQTPSTTDSANPQGAGQPHGPARAGPARLWSVQVVAGSGWRGSAQAGRAGRSENLAGNLDENLSENLCENPGEQIGEQMDEQNRRKNR